jgi:hypothetical protein
MDWIRLEFQAIKSALRPEPQQPVNVTINNEQPAVNIDVEAQPREYKIDVQPTPITVENIVNVPKQEQAAPIVNVQVSPTPLTVENVVNVPKQDALKVEVREIPVQATKGPKSRTEKQKIVRGKDGKMQGTETEVEYKY